MGKLVYYADTMRHLICVPYSITNLHRMARDLGIKRCWYHAHPLFPHYDIPKRRIVEIQSKCNMVNARELLEIIKESLATRGELTGVSTEAILLATKKRDNRYGKSKSVRQIRKAGPSL